MGKKSILESTNAKSKRGQVKRKEMFNELTTKQESMVERAAENTSKRVMDKIKREDPIDEESSSKEEINLSLSKKGQVDDICEAVNKLFAKNKINVRNAFEVPIVDLENLSDFQQTIDNEHAWKKLSSTLENDYKIYSFRVDAIHTIAFNILNNMHRREEDPEDLIQANKDVLKKQEENLSFFSNEGGEADKNQLQKNISNLNVNDLEMSCRVDPILERTKRQFDFNGLASLFLNTLSVDPSCSISLISADKIKESEKNLSWGVNSSDEWSCIHPLQVFKVIDKVTSQINYKLFNEQKSNYNAEELWKAVNRGKIENYIHSKPSNYDEMKRQDEIMIDQSSEPNHKFIHNFISIKKEPRLRTIQDIEADADQWMGPLEKKLLGIKSTGFITKKVAPTKFENEDFIDFETFEEDSDGILMKQFEKGECYLEHEDIFLMPLKLFNQFHVEKNLSLREQIEEFLPQGPVEEGNFDLQIDQRRQQVSIKETKQKLLHLIQGKSSFNSVHKQYNATEAEISSTLCFLTILHLANQNHLTFQQQDQTDFYIQ